MAKAPRKGAQAPSAPEAKIVEGTGVASSVNGSDLSRKLEAAQVAAITDCLNRGISDPEEQKAAMKAAREKVLSEG